MNREPIGRRDALVLITAIFAMLLMYAGTMWYFFAYTIPAEIYPIVIPMIMAGTAYILYLSAKELAQLAPALWSAKSASAPEEKK